MNYRVVYQDLDYEVEADSAKEAGEIFVSEVLLDVEDEYDLQVFDHEGNEWVVLVSVEHEPVYDTYAQKVKGKK